MNTTEAERIETGSPRPTKGLFLYAFVYAGLVLLIHAGGFAGNLGIPEGRETLIFETLQASSKLVGQFALFGLAVLALNLVPLLMLFWSMRVADSLLEKMAISRFTYFLLAISSGWIAALAFNKVHFPQSSFALLFPVESSAMLHWVGGISLAGYLLLGVLPAAWRVTGLTANLLKRRSAQMMFAGILAIATIPPMYSNWSTASGSTHQPDIIVIGLDSFSPLHLRNAQGKLPLLEGMLKESTVFTQTLTPLARTFPAWTSILTARYPVHSGARFNLTHFDQVDARVTLAKLMQARGYTTIYAQDERKFNNIDEHFGFDATVGPEPGAAEFVMTKVADQPLVNLALLSPWADKLFPFVANNRAAAVQYEPDDFVDAITDRLPRDRSKPLFLATHFCLAHYPYTWRSQGAWPGNGEKLTYEQKHVRALGVLEGQVARLLEALKKQGRLDNAILVMLSDHGESMGYQDGLWVSMYKADSLAEKFIVNGFQAFAAESGFTGHGSQVLDRTQYQSLLVFRGYGPQKAKFPAESRERMASLVDVMPTLFGALDLEVPPNLDGLDVMADVQDGAPRVIPTETGIRFSALTSVLNVDEAQLLAESKEYYRVDPETARLVVKAERYADLVSTKDIAVHTDDWMLALLRKDRSPSFPRVALLVHKPTGAWTLGHNDKLIAKAPLETLVRSAEHYYGGELDDFSRTWAFRSVEGRALAAY